MKLPRLFHIGTQKAGSTYLFNLLKRHPEISLSPLQKVNFYAQNFHKGVEWYVNAFVGEGCRIDTSPKYFLSGQQAAIRIKDLVGDQHPLFLLMLRNPIDYVHSHYQMHLRTGYFAQNKRIYPEVPTNLIAFARIYPGYLNRGFYCRTLEQYWLSHFDDNQFKIVFFEEFVNNTDKVIREVLEFFELSVRPLHTVPASKNKMLRHSLLYKVRDYAVKSQRLKSALKGSKIFNFIYDKWLTAPPPRLTQAERAWLREHFAQDVVQLERKLGRDVPWFDFQGG